MIKLCYVLLKGHSAEIDPIYISDNGIDFELVKVVNDRTYCDILINEFIFKDLLND